MSNEALSAPRDCPAWARTLPEDIQTPCFVIHEQGIVDNLHATVRACGGVNRLMPHVKTHRAGWVVELLLQLGVSAFKASTVAETAMVLAAGAPYVVWAYPSASAANIRALIKVAARHPQARIGALVDSAAGLEVWRKELAVDRSGVSNLKLIVDLDPGMGRTGAPLSQSALDLAGEIAALNRFGGFHVYDGHIQGADAESRAERIGAVMAQVADLMARAAEECLSTELIAGGSYSFTVWPPALATYVGPGSWTYSSDQHDAELTDLGWQPSAFVLATVISTRGETATLDAGSKAISPDKPLSHRFRWDGKILMMSEEHVVVDNPGLAVGDRVLLMPRHACTTAYLYDKALVFGRDGKWVFREQLGSRRQADIE